MKSRTMKTSFWTTLTCSLGYLLLVLACLTQWRHQRPLLQLDYFSGGYFRSEVEDYENKLLDDSDVLSRLLASRTGLSDSVAPPATLVTAGLFFWWLSGIAPAWVDLLSFVKPAGFSFVTR